MSVIKDIKALFKRFFSNKKEDIKTETIYPKGSVVEEVHSLWDYINFNMHSQAYHICNVLGFEEWVSMDEILRRIKELFGVAYKNDRSLYPYIKTLVDCSLLETSAFSGKKQWRKRDLVIKFEEIPKKPTQSPEIITQIQKQAD